jgi:hypothetical protein
MIVRISGTGQYELDMDACKHIDPLDDALTDALHRGDEQEFHAKLHEMVRLIQSTGTPVPHDRVVPSDVIVPPEDVTLDEAKRFFTDEGLMEPLPA